jgi:hypothetical protein
MLKTLGLSLRKPKIQRIEITALKRSPEIAAITLRIDTLCHEGLASQKVMRFSRLTFRKQNMPQTV